MKSTSQAVTVVTYSSDVMPEVSSTIESHGETIAWADAHKVVWKIVNASKSAPFGWKSSTYIGWAQGNPTVAAMLARVEAFRRELEHPAESIWQWRAKFTLKHYGEKGFKGGFFTQHDAQYRRGCVQLDYTPETREEVIDQFVAWCAASPGRFVTREVKIDDVVVRRYDAKGRVVR